MSFPLRGAILTCACLIFPIIVYGFLRGDQEHSRVKRFLDRTFDPDQD